MTAKLRHIAITVGDLKKEAAFFESGDGGAHRLRADAFGAGKIGGGGGAVDVEAAHHGGFGERNLVRSGGRAHAANERGDGVDEVDGLGVVRFLGHDRSVT